MTISISLLLGEPYGSDLVAATPYCCWQPRTIKRGQLHDAEVCSALPMMSRRTLPHPQATGQILGKGALSKHRLKLYLVPLIKASEKDCAAQSQDRELCKMEFGISLVARSPHRR
jgi:hypothetical protein